jgi:hypothetical protein
MSKYHITPESNAEIMRHMLDWSKYVDADLIGEWNAGISFLYDFGLINLGQYGELSRLFPEEVQP